MALVDKVVNGFFSFVTRFVSWVERKNKSGWFSRKKIIRLAIILIFIFCVHYVFTHFVKFFGMPASVVIVTPRSVPVHLNYVGNTASIQDVEIRARVEGFLIKQGFIDGADVKKGDMLFVIDKKPYEAQLAQAKGQLAKDKAALKFAREQVKRYEPLAKKDFISRESYDQYVTQAAEAAAAVAADQAQVKQAKLNLGYCTMRAPFSGRTGRRLVDVGNLVGASEKTELTTLVQLDPLYVYFSPSDEDMLHMAKYQNEGGFDVELTLTDGTKYPNKGTTDFVDNTVDQQTSTVVMRAVVPNPDYMLLPGVYTNVQLHITDKEDALLIPQKAVMQDQGGSYVMVVGKGRKAHQKYITLGETYGEKQLVTNGLEKGDRIVTSRLQIIKPGMKVWSKVEEEEVTMRSVVRRAIEGT